MRLFSIVSWHHFAYMIISIALLGFGASGTTLALAQRKLLPHFRAVFAASAALFAVMAIASFAVAIRLPFNPLAIVWDARQLFWLTLIYALLVLPFLAGCDRRLFPLQARNQPALRSTSSGLGSVRSASSACCFCYLPRQRCESSARLACSPQRWILLPGVVRRRSRLGAGLGVAAAVVALWLPSSLISLHRHVSEYRASPWRSGCRARASSRRSSPLGLISVVESPTIPFRHAPGLSLNNTVEPLLQLGVFTDAEAISAITRFEGDLKRLSYLDFTTSALPYHLLGNPTVLILGASGGEQVLLALYHGARQIDAVELNPQVLDLVVDKYADFAGGIYGRPEVELHIGEARSFVERADDRYHLIQIPLLYSFGATAAGTQSLHENYTYTVEAIGNYLNHLQPDGLLSITLWLKLPPRDMLKLFATAVGALTERGITVRGRRADPQLEDDNAHCQERRLTATDIATLKDFATGRSFDLDYYPGHSR